MNSCRKDEVREPFVFRDNLLYLLFVCKRDWSIPIHDDNICPWIVNDRLPYPVGGTNTSDRSIIV